MRSGARGPGGRAERPRILLASPGRAERNAFGSNPGVAEKDPGDPQGSRVVLLALRARTPAEGPDDVNARSARDEGLRQTEFGPQGPFVGSKRTGSYANRFRRRSTAYASNATPLTAIPATSHGIGSKPPQETDEPGALPAGSERTPCALHGE